MPVTALAPGWFGKTMALGDFAHRRLPLPVVQTLDGWLSECVQQSRLALGGAWLTHYLNAPVWAFSISSGVLERHASQAWVGVLMASCDSVGRYFPLMLLSTTSGASHQDASTAAQSSQAWYEQLAHVAMDTLAPQATVDSLETALMSLPTPPPASSAAQGQSRPDNVGQSLWWVQEPPTTIGAGGVTLVCDGLPSPSRFAAMLQGLVW